MLRLNNHEGFMKKRKGWPGDNKMPPRRCGNMLNASRICLMLKEVPGMGTSGEMGTFDWRSGRNLRLIQCSLEVLTNLEYLLSTSKPLSDDQIEYCLMLHDEIAKLKSLFFDSTL
jgi:hypothetical protein